MYYLVKTPWWFKKLYPGCIWQMPATEKIIYLSFDDGPQPMVTEFVLNELKKYEATASFFCIGSNVAENQEMYRRILDEGHRVGNHTQDHLNGWHVKDREFIDNIDQAKKWIDSDLFRPPYGKITRFQIKLLKSLKYQFNIIMWTVLSGDFDEKLSKEDCLLNVLKNTGNGSIVVFHDSEKAFEKLQFVLPKVLSYFAEKGYQFQSIKL